MILNVDYCVDYLLFCFQCVHVIVYYYIQMLYTLMLAVIMITVIMLYKIVFVIDLATLCSTKSAVICVC